MRNITLGTTGITAPQNGFGALPIQRIPEEDAVHLLRKAYDGGMRYFDTARAYSNSEERVGLALSDVRHDLFIATKTQALDPDGINEQLDTSLRLLKTDYIDVYQIHCAEKAYAPGDGTGIYETMLRAKEDGKILHIGITAHKIQVAFDAVNSGLYETLQFPMSYLASEKEMELLQLCKEKNVGFIAMKGMAGGLITNSRAMMAFVNEHDNIMPIWGIQRESELDEWLSYMEDTPVMTDEIRAVIEKDRKELVGNFCRGCGYCLPCPVDIIINNCARMSLMLRRAPSEAWTTPYWQEEMAKIENCLECGQCASRCPYELDTPQLLKDNLADYKKVLSGEVKV